MNKFYTTALFCLFALVGFSQTTGTLKGKLIDTVGKQSLKDASITILDAKDSTLEVFGLSKEGGLFEVKNISFGNFIVQISFQGYQPIYKKLVVTKENAVVDFGNIYMQIQAKNLDEVVVTQSPIVIKKDTIEYNAGSFKTKPNAVVEDLLKKLPGVEVAKDGSIKAQGETVSRVLVDGKRFFGDDPKMATKNLPPDMVDKVQIYDAQSDQSAFSGFDDGNRTKTINITTKKDKRKGYFGKIMAGGGDQGRFESGLNLNRFNGNQQMSIIAQANNVNRQAFSVQDILGTMNIGAMGNARGGGNAGASIGNTIQGLGGGNTSSGITTTVAGGINYKDVWGKKTEAYGSYFYNNLAIDRQSNALTERFISGDSSIFTNQLTKADNKNQNHRFNYNIEHQFDSSNSLIVRPNFSYQETDNESVTTTNTTRGKLTNINNILQTTTSSNSGYNGTIDATFRHRFKKRGRTYSINLTTGGSANNGNGSNISTTNFSTSSIAINQINRTKTDAQNISGNLSYTEPLSKNTLLELSYNYSFRNNVSDRQTFALNSTTNTYNIAVDSLSNNFENVNESHRATIGYRIQNAKYNLGFTNGLQFATLNSENRTKGYAINRNFVNLFPTANFTYNFSRTKNLRINYNGRTNQPSVTQLQPVPDNSDQTNIRVGNSDLTQEFTNSLRIFFTSFDIFKMRNIFALLNISTTSNKIVNDITQFKTGINSGNQLTTYKNANGVYSISGYFNYGFQLKKPKSNLNFSTNVNHDRSVSFINQQKNYTYNTTFGETIGWTMNWKEKLDLNVNATSTYNIVKYSVQKEQNANFFSQNLSLEPTYTFKGGWVIGSEFDYTYNSGRASGFNTNVPLWNASVSKLLFKKQNGELKFSIYDLLNQNVSISRTVNNNFVQDIRTNVLQRYFSITFTYNIRKFAGQQQQMPAMFRNMMRGGNLNNMRRMMN